MDQLVCEKSVIEGPHCHCQELDGSLWARLLPEEKATMAEVTDERGIPERQRP